jgi:hypothetical protein
VIAIAELDPNFLYDAWYMLKPGEYAEEDDFDDKLDDDAGNRKLNNTDSASEVIRSTLLTSAEAEHPSTTAAGTFSPRLSTILSLPMTLASAASGVVSTSGSTTSTTSTTVSADVSPTRAAAVHQAIAGAKWVRGTCNVR